MGTVTSCAVYYVWFECFCTVPVADGLGTWCSVYICALLVVLQFKLAVVFMSTIFHCFSMLGYLWTTFVITSRVIYSDQLGISEFLHIILCEKLQFAIWCAPKKVRRRVILNILYSCKSVAVKFSIILMALAIERIPNLPSHVTYISTLPDITQKPKNYVVFLSVVWEAVKRTGFGVSEVAVKRTGCVQAHRERG